MELDKGKKTIISVMFILVLATVITAAAYFGLRGGKTEKPSSGDSPIDTSPSTSSGSYNGGSVYIGSSLPTNQPPNSPPEVIGSVANFNTFVFGTCLTKFIDDAAAAGTDISAVKPTIDEFNAMKCSDPVDDGTAGYIALFTLLYSDLKDESTPRHKIFFDTNRYGNIKAPTGFTTVAEFFESLKTKLSIYGKASDYLKHNHHQVIFALRYIMIKHILGVKEAIKEIVDRSFPFLQIDFKRSAHNDAGREQLFKDVYVPNALSDIYNKAFWLTYRELMIFGCIFKLDVLLATFDTSIGVAAAPPANEVLFRFGHASTGKLLLAPYTTTTLFTDNPHNATVMKIHLVKIDDYHFIPVFN